VVVELGEEEHQQKPERGPPALLEERAVPAADQVLAHNGARREDHHQPEQEQRSGRYQHQVSERGAVDQSARLRRRGLLGACPGGGPAPGSLRRRLIDSRRTSARAASVASGSAFERVPPAWSRACSAGTPGDPPGPVAWPCRGGVLLGAGCLAALFDAASASTPPACHGRLERPSPVLVILIHVEGRTSGREENTRFRRCHLECLRHGFVHVRRPHHSPVRFFRADLEHRVCDLGRALAIRTARSWCHHRVSRRALPPAPRNRVPCSGRHDCHERPVERPHACSVA